MKKKIIIPLLVATGIVAATVTVVASYLSIDHTKCPTEKAVEAARSAAAYAATQEAENDTENKTEENGTDSTLPRPVIKREGDTIILPDGRSFPMAEGESYAEIGNGNDAESYSVTGLKDSFKHVEIRYSQIETNYYFICDMDSEDGNITWENIDTNVDGIYSGENERTYQTDQGLTIILSDHLEISDIRETVMQTISINGVEYSSEDYLNEARDYFTKKKSPYTEVYQADDITAEVNDYWTDADDVNFKVRLQIGESNNFYRNSDIRVYIGY
jgi:hypothetical protein